MGGDCLIIPVAAVLDIEHSVQIEIASLRSGQAGTPQTFGGVPGALGSRKFDHTQGADAVLGIGT